MLVCFVEIINCLAFIKNKKCIFFFTFMFMSNHLSAKIPTIQYFLKVRTTYNVMYA